MNMNRLISRLYHNLIKVWDKSHFSILDDYLQESPKSIVEIIHSYNVPNYIKINDNLPSPLSSILILEQLNFPRIIFISIIDLRFERDHNQEQIVDNYNKNLLEDLSSHNIPIYHVNLTSSSIMKKQRDADDIIFSIKKYTF